MLTPHPTSRFAVIPALLALLAVAHPAPIRAQNVAIAVDTSQAVRTVDERVFGVNAVAWDPQTASAQTISLLQAAGIRAIRIPGGGLSDEYHWLTNTTLTNTGTWPAGFNAFGRLIAGLNSQAFVTVNYGTGTPQEAAAWVAYANASANLRGTSADVVIGVDVDGFDWGTAGYWSALRAAQPLASDDGRNFLRLGQAAPFGLRYWEVGNECYGTWETDIQTVAHDPVVYANRFDQYFTQMKAVDPTIKIGAVATTTTEGPYNYPSRAVTNPVTHLQETGWTPVMLSTMTVTPDYLICHRYEQNAGQENDATLLQLASAPATGWPVDAALLRGALNDYFGTSAAANVELCVTENNSVHNNPGKQLTSLVNGLFLADSVGSLLQTEFNAMVWWDVRNGPPTDNNGRLVGNQSASLYGWRLFGDYGILSTPYAITGETTFYNPYPTYYVIKLLSRFARGGDTVVRATSSSTLLSAYAVRRADGTLAVLVINKSPTAAQTATITLTGFVPPTPAAVYSYGIPQDEAARTGNGSTDLASSSLANISSTFSASFAPYSATVLALVSGVPAITTPPASQTVNSGLAASFSVTATGTAPLSYQWYKSGTVISGATSSTLSLSNVQSSDAGSYTVAVSNSITTTTSNAATLTVTTPAPPPPPPSGGGGGGGGALSVWFYATLAALAAARLRARR